MWPIALSLHLGDWSAFAIDALAPVAARITQRVLGDSCLSADDTCHRQGVNPLAWATDVLGKLQDGWPRDRLDELLPYAWVKPTSPELIEQDEAA